MQIEILLTQHKMMLQVVDRIAGLRPEKDAEAIAHELSVLKAALQAHLNTEDRHLYPALRSFGERPDAPLGLKMNIKNFFDEMEGIKPVAEGFLTKWTAEAIAEAPQEFREAFSGIADVLGQRIAREESRLYPLYTQHVQDQVPLEQSQVRHIAASQGHTQRLNARQEPTARQQSAQEIDQRSSFMRSGKRLLHLWSNGRICSDAAAIVGLAAGSVTLGVVGGTQAPGPLALWAVFAALAFQTAGAVAIALQLHRRDSHSAKLVTELTHALAEVGSTRFIGSSSAAHDAPEELAAFADQLTRTHHALRDMLAKVGEGARRVASQAAALGSEASSLARSAQSQAEDTEVAAAVLENLVTSMHQVASNAESLASGMGETCASVAELVASIEQVSAHVAEAYRREAEASKIADGGLQMVNESIAGMARIESAMAEILTTIEALGQSSQEIGAITSLIDDIADQTNLLALNATIEAARAGEHGRGFAVVAQEVKRLADGSAKATQDIGLRLQGIKHDTERLMSSTRTGSEAVRDGVRVTKNAGLALDAIVTAVKESATLMEQIAQATEEQKAASEQITAKVESMTHMTQRVSKATDEQQRDSEKIVAAVETLNAAALRGAASAADVARSVTAVEQEGRSLTAALEAYDAHSDIAAAPRSLERRVDGAGVPVARP